MCYILKIKGKRVTGRKIGTRADSSLVTFYLGISHTWGQRGPSRFSGLRSVFASGWK